MSKQTLTRDKLGRFKKRIRSPYEAWREGQKEAYEDIRDTYWTFKHENSTFDLERILAYRFDALGKDHD